MSGENTDPGNSNAGRSPEEMYTKILEELETIINMDHPSTESIQKALDNLAKGKEKLAQLATEIEINPGKGKSGGRRASKRGLKRKKDTVEGAGIKRRKDDEAEEVSRKLKTKWRQLEEKDLKDTAAMTNEEPNEGAGAVAAPKLGRRSRYIDALQAFTGYIIQKKVYNKETWVPVSPDDADDYMEVVRSIISPGAIVQLVAQVKLLTERPSAPESALIQKDLHPDCYDQSGDLNNLGKMVRLSLETIRNETGTSTRRILSRRNCVEIAQLYEKTQQKKRALKETDADCEKGSRGKGVATDVKKGIIRDVGCTLSRLDNWIKIGKAFAPFINQFGFGVLGLFPHEISDSRILGLPVNATPLIVSTMEDLQPNLGDLSMLIEEHLLTHLLDQSSPNAQSLRTMLTRAKELDLQMPFKRVLDSITLSTPGFVEEES